MKETAIVILNYNGLKFLADFLPILIKNTPDSAEIIVADNASTDNSVKLLEEKFPEIGLIVLPKNYGYAEGYNQALKQINCKYYVLLNSDVEVSANWLPPLIKLLEVNPDIAASQPKILSYNEKNNFEYAGAAGGYIDYFGYPFCRGRIISNIEQDLGQYDDTKKIFWASGACLAIKSEAFHKIGGFDGDFFAHMEEIDLCWRLQLAGYEIQYTSLSTVYHVGGGTLHKSNPFKTYLNFRNGLWMIFKNMPSKYFYLRIFCRMVMDGIAALSFLAKGQFKDFKAVFKAHISFYANIPQLLKKRAEIKKLPNSQTILPSIYKLSIIWEVLKRKKIKFSDLGNLKIPNCRLFGFSDVFSDIHPKS